MQASDIVRRVRVRLEAADRVLNCNNWYDHDDPHHEDNDDNNEDDYRERASASAICLRKGTTTTTAMATATTASSSSAADYVCSFFYDHAQESLHRIKLDV